jgi:hypothetical protein
VQPAQLSLMPDQLPAPPPAIAGHLPDGQVTAAAVLLGRLIARAAGLLAGTGQEDDDE